MSENLIKWDDAPQLPAELQEKLETESKENLEGVEPRLPKLQMPTGRGKEFSLDAQGSEPIDLKEVIGVILFQTPSNAYWKEAFGGGNAVLPDCASHDGLTPSDQYDSLQAESCARCVHNRFGSARDPEGNKMPGKACRNVKRVVVLRADDPTIPVLLTIPPGSLRAFDDYMVLLAKEKRPYWTVATKLTIKTESNRAGIDYPMAVFTIAGYINNKETLDTMIESKKQWIDMLKATLFMQDDVAPNPEEGTAATPRNATATATPVNEDDIPF